MKAIKRFQDLCEFPKLPKEVDYLAGQIKNIMKHNQALADNYYDGEALFRDRASEWEKSAQWSSKRNDCSKAFF